VWTALDGQTGQLVQSNESKQRVLDIHASCKAAQDKLLAELEPKKPWYWPF
jgi:hypothetical protein